MSKYDKYKTDEERLSVIHSIPYTDWVYIDHWEDEAETEEAREIFHSAIRRMYHTEEFYA